AVETRDRRAVGAHDLAPLVAARAALSGQHRGRQLDRVERPGGDWLQDQGAAELGIVPGVARAVPPADGAGERGGIDTDRCGEGGEAIGLLDPAFRQFGAIVLAPLVALDDLGPAMARV